MIPKQIYSLFRCETKQCPEWLIDLPRITQLQCRARIDIQASLVPGVFPFHPASARTRQQVFCHSKIK
jgi:hypothetical protein